MTLDKTLQKIIQRAEDYRFTGDPSWNGALQKENARLLPIIQGLCEEVQRLRGKLEWIDLRCPEHFINDTNSPHKIHVEAAYDAGVCANAALSTSALEKLGGGDE